MAGYGFVPVPRNPEKILSGYTKESPYVPFSQLRVPQTKLCLAIERYAREELSPQTYDHSTRVYFYGTLMQVSFADDAGEAIMKHHFPDWDHNSEVPLVFAIQLMSGVLSYLYAPRYRHNGQEHQSHQNEF